MGVNKSNTICWNCANATDRLSCEWVRNATPVQGWVAIKQKNWEFESYNVISCPKFTKDVKVKRSAEMMTDETASAIVEAIVDRAIRDWKWADKVQRGVKRVWKESQIKPDAMKENVEKFFRGRWFKTICGDLDGEAIIKKLQRGEI